MDKLIFHSINVHLLENVLSGFNFLFFESETFRFLQKVELSLIYHTLLGYKDILWRHVILHHLRLRLVSELIN